jgi:replicative DNA helicase
MNNYEIEGTLLGNLILDSKLINEHYGLLHIDLFEHQENREIYNAILALYKKDKEINFLTISKILKSDELIYRLTEVVDVQFSLDNDTLTCIQILSEQHMKRALFALIQNVNNKLSQDEDIFDIINFVENGAKALIPKENEITSNLNEQINNLLLDICNRMQSNELFGITTGFKEIDNFTGGWQKTDLIIIGGASSMGKTSLALAFAYNAAKYANTPVVIFSYEMSSLQLLRRLVSVETRIDNKYIANGFINEEDLKTISDATQDIEAMPLIIDECNITSLIYLRNKIRKYTEENNIELVLVDYLQLVTYSNKNSSREQEVSKVTRTLKNLAKELNITIIALSQLNRGVGMRTNSKPTLADLRESGEIEQAADIVMLIYRPEYYKIEFDDDGNITTGVANIIFAKGRNIGIGEIKLKFIPEITKFENYE